MQLNAPLTPTLSPSEGEREKNSRAFERSLNGDFIADGRSSSLSLSERETTRVRVRSVFLVTAE
jgi:hypothetical protein